MITLLVMSASCASTKVRAKKKITIEDLKIGNELYGVKDNAYFYFMIDSVGRKHLVKTHMMNSQRVIWTEPLIKQ